MSFLYRSLQTVGSILYSPISWYYSTPVHTLEEEIEAQNIEGVRAMLNSGVDVNRVNEKGQTPLNLAIEKGNLEIVKLLLNDSRIDITCGKESAIKLAIRIRDSKTVVLLLKKSETDTKELKLKKINRYLVKHHLEKILIKIATFLEKIGIWKNERALFFKWCVEVWASVRDYMPASTASLKEQFKNDFEPFFKYDTCDESSWLEDFYKQISEKGSLKPGEASIVWPTLVSLKIYSDEEVQVERNSKGEWHFTNLKISIIINGYEYKGIVNYMSNANGKLTINFDTTQKGLQIFSAKQILNYGISKSYFDSWLHDPKKAGHSMRWVQARG